VDSSGFEDVVGVVELHVVDDLGDVFAILIDRGLDLKGCHSTSPFSIFEDHLLVRSERLVLSVRKDGFIGESLLHSRASCGRFHDVVVSEGNSISRLCELAGRRLAQSVHELSILSSIGEWHSGGICGSKEDKFYGLQIEAVLGFDFVVVGADQSVGVVEEDRNNVSDTWEGSGEGGGVEVICIRKSESGFQPLDGSLSNGFQFCRGDRNGILDGLVVIEYEGNLVQIVNLVVHKDENRF